MNNCRRPYYIKHGIHNIPLYPTGGIFPSTLTANLIFLYTGTINNKKIHHYKKKMSNKQTNKKQTQDMRINSLVVQNESNTAFPRWQILNKHWLISPSSCVPSRALFSSNELRKFIMTSSNGNIFRVSGPL